MNRFKEGDRVVCVDARPHKGSSSASLVAGEVYVVCGTIMGNIQIAGSRYFWDELRFVPAKVRADGRLV